MNYDESLDMNHILYKSRRSEINFIAITYDLQSILAKYSWIVKLYWRNISQTTTKGSGFYLHISARLYTPELKKNIAKGTTDLRVEFISQVLTQNLIRFHLHNINQAATSKSWPNIIISTKVEIQNIDQTQLQNLEHNSTS